MLIVSQDKNTIVNLDLIESIDATDSNIIKAFTGGDFEGNERYYEVASYKNEERALAVLRMLWSYYASGENVFIMPGK